LAKGRYRVQWVAPARADLLEAVAFIRREQPAAARRIYVEIQRQTKLLRMHPMLGRVVPEFGNRYLRELIISPSRIIYRLLPHARIAEVLAVVHSARSLPGA
jgi:toxin ParE1/3/4